MSSDFASLHKILKDETRRNIVKMLDDFGPLSYTQIMGNLGFQKTGLLNYHLKALDDLITKNENGQYTLTEKGKLSARFLKEFPNPAQTNNSAKPRWWRRFWITAIIVGSALAIISVAAFLLGLISIDALYQSLYSILGAIGITYTFQHVYRNVISNLTRKKINKFLFIFGGGFGIGFLLWIGVL
jgi:hypothetical protein